MTEFARFYGSLPTDRYHVFIRDYLYTFHGVQARELASRFFSSQQKVVNQTQGIDTLTCGKKLLGDIASNLIFERCEQICIWKRDDEASQNWVRALEGSPGRFGDLEKFLGGFFGNGQNEKEPVIASLSSDKTGRVGIAVFNSVAGTVKVFDFLDDRTWTDTETCLTQHGVREVLVAESGVGSKRKCEDSSSFSPPSSKIHSSNEYMGDFKQVVRKAGVFVTQIAPSYFKSSKSSMGTNSGLVEDIIALSSGLIVAEDIDKLSCGRASLAALIEYNVDLRESKGTKQFSFSIESIGSQMQYDGNVIMALNIFPVGPTVFQRRLSSYTTVSGGADEGGASKEEGSYADIEENVFGDIVTETSASGDSLGIGRSQTHSSSCLLDFLKCTKTNMGSRLMKRWLQRPERNLSIIKRRQALITLLVDHGSCRSVLRDDVECLKRCPDLEKVSLKFRDSRSLRSVKLADLITLYRGIVRLNVISKQLSDLEKSSTKGSIYMLSIAERSIKTLEKFMALVEELVDVVALGTKGGGDSSGEAVGWKRARLTGERWIQVRPTFTPQMSRVHAEMSKTLDLMDQERSRVVNVTGLDSKAVHLETNSIQGIHLRVTKKDTSKVTKTLGKDGFKILSQQKAGSMFLTPQMSSVVNTYNRQKSDYQKLQEEVVLQAAVVAATYLHAIGDAAAVIAEIDCLSALAQVAAVHEWCCPEMNEDKPLELKGLRHPIVEAHVGASNYVASDFVLSGSVMHNQDEAGGIDGSIFPRKNTMILTGPNMGGKSTFIRAVGLAVILAHIGSYVPAASAVVPLFDRVLTRVGANDSLNLGVSTFMSEMKDVSAILRKATKHSLVIIDELGRGTSTHEGFGIAWAALEQLASRGALTLFATHFHELTEMSAEMSGIVNKHVDASVDSNADRRITMLYEVRDGPANDSMGFNVARLAGFPSEVVAAAESMTRDAA